jgi:hypothetical protein
MAQSATIFASIVTLGIGLDARAQISTRPFPIPDGPAPPPAAVAQARATLSPMVGPNVRCNSRDICPNGKGKVQAEVAVAISCNTVICGYNDSRGYFCPELGYTLAGWAVSDNGGASFTDGGGFPGQPELDGDPWVVSVVDGALAFSTLWSRQTYGLAVYRGPPGAETFEWEDPAVLNIAGSVLDKESMGVDPVAGTVYLVFTRVPQSSGIWLYRSDNAGHSFDGPYPVYLAHEPFGGPVVAVGTVGEVNVAWFSGDHTSFAQSMDGGRTFGSAHNIGAVCDPHLPLASLPFPQIAVDTTQGTNSGNIYVVWHSTCPGGTSNVVLVRSSDDGATWSDPIVVNDGPAGAEHFYPTISVDRLGRVNVFFYDRRDNPGTRLTNLYFAQSTDGGLSFNPNLRVTDVASDWQTVPGDLGPIYGDYITSFSVDNTACAGYADSRDGDPDAYFTCVTIPPD